MKKTLILSACAVMLGSSAYAGGLDRSGQSMSILFEKGTYAELSFGMIKPTASGVGNGTVNTETISNVANNYSQTQLGFKTDVNDQLSYAIILDQPFGSNTAYGATGVNFGSTGAKINSSAITTMLRYKFSDRISVHGGLRAQTINSDLSLGGTGFGGFGLRYAATFASNMGLGYSVGAAYEIPEIALRVALTYNSKVKHNFATTENGTPTGITNVETPESWNLEFQSGIAADTLVFGSIRYAKWGDFDLIPPFFGADLADLDDSTTYSIGVGRKFSDKLSGSISLSYEKEGDPLVSPLSPTNGKLGIGLGLKYTMDKVEISGGVSYTKVGDANPKSGTNVALANFSGNNALAFGMKIGYRF
ncbi:MAG: hypothetical protein P8Q99_14845 [Paracoccaceae bacterium]|nr:hypothetical protein [Paracoccaceae bacterium]